MKITHIAIWTKQLEAMKDFYIKYFEGKSNEKYVNETKGFESYFINFEGEATLEIMSSTQVTKKKESPEKLLGICHFAFELDSRDKVNQLTDKIRKDGFQVAGNPRVTGDGFYESVILDLDGNCIELVSK